MEDFERFYRENVRLVAAIAAGRVGDPAQAEDLVQEAFLRAWQHYPQVSELPAPAQRAWLVRTLRNLATDAWRRRMVEEAAPSPAGPPAEQTDLRLDVDQALAELPAEDRDLVVMRYVDGLNSREIGEALGAPEGTIRRRLSDCRQVLSARLRQWAPQGVV